MTTAIIALLGRRDPYAVDGGGSGTRASTVAGWRDFLDAVDELALDPAGAPDGLAAGLLARYGVAPEAELLARRAEARAAYRALAADGVGLDDARGRSGRRSPAGGSRRPSTAIRAADGTWELTGETDALLPEVGRPPRDRRGGVAGGERRSSDLRAASALARRQLAAARDVAEARAILDQPLDLVQQVGRFATDVPAVDDAILAVRAADDDAAAEVAAQIRSTVAGLRADGEQRIVLGTVDAPRDRSRARRAWRRDGRSSSGPGAPRRGASRRSSRSRPPTRPGRRRTRRRPPGRSGAARRRADAAPGPAPIVVPTTDGDPEIAKLVRPRPPRPEG